MSDYFLSPTAQKDLAAIRDYYDERRGLLSRAGSSLNSLTPFVSSRSSRMPDIFVRTLQAAVRDY